MVLDVKPRMTVEEFEAFVALPENEDKLFEFIGGEIFEVPSNPYSSKIAMRIGRYLDIFVEQHDLGHVTGEAGGYWVSGERYAPDVAFIAKERQAELVKEGYNPNPPNLAVEVISPQDRPHNLHIKIANYLAAGTLVWIVYPESQEIEVFEPNQPVKTLGVNDTLDGGNVLQGFKLEVKKIFP